jgi:hypothetical protein
MKKNLLLQLEKENLRLDHHGRIIIKSKKLLALINGASNEIQKQEHINGDNGHCPRANDKCHNYDCPDTMCRNIECQNSTCHH